MREIIDLFMNEMNISAGVYMRNDIFYTMPGIVNLQPSVGTQWVMFTNQNYFVSYGCPPPVNMTEQVNGCICSKYQIQKNGSYCAAYCLYVLYFTHLICFRNAVLILYYQEQKFNK